VLAEESEGDSSPLAQSFVAPIPANTTGIASARRTNSGTEEGWTWESQEPLIVSALLDALRSLKVSFMLVNNVCKQKFTNFLSV
jgi:hypothetical protein